jgi:hypothetical protein
LANRSGCKNLGFIELSISPCLREGESVLCRFKISKDFARFRGGWVRPSFCPTPDDNVWSAYRRPAIVRLLIVCTRFLSECKISRLFPDNTFASGRQLKYVSSFQASF